MPTRLSFALNQTRRLYLRRRWSSTVKLQLGEGPYLGMSVSIFLPPVNHVSAQLVVVCWNPTKSNEDSPRWTSRGFTGRCQATALWKYSNPSIAAIRLRFGLNFNSCTTGVTTGPTLDSVNPVCGQSPSPPTGSRMCLACPPNRRSHLVQTPSVICWAFYLCI